MLWQSWGRFLEACEAAGAVLLLVVAGTFALDVAGRYALGVTASWLVDLEWYLSAVALCLSFGAALRAGAHVRVDVLHARLGASTRQWVERLGHLLLLLPWCAFVVYAASRYAYNSFLVGEGSPDPGGLPLRWVVKAFVPLGFALLGLEGLRQLIGRRPTSPTLSSAESYRDGPTRHPDQV